MGKTTERNRIDCGDVSLLMGGGWTVDRCKPTIVFTRPRDWLCGGYGSELFNLVYVPISGPVPRKRNGKLAGDGIGDVITSKGLDLLFKAIKEFKPEFLFHSIHRKMLESTLAPIRRISPDTFIAVSDGNQPHDVSAYVRRFRNYTDGVLINSDEMRTRKKYKLLGYSLDHVRTLYDGFDPAEHVPSNEHPQYDCFFAGGNHRTGKKWRFPGGKFRRDLIVKINSRFRLLLHGVKDEWSVPTLPILSYPDYFPAFQHAKIVIGCNHYSLNRYYTRRTIHSLASGRLYLTRYIPGMEDDFTNHRHLVWFKKIDEAVELIGHYLKHDNERQKIGENGRLLALKSHTWEARLREFEKICMSWLKLKVKGEGT